MSAVEPRPAAAEPNPAIRQTAELIAHSTRTPVLRRPDEFGMDYEEVFFPSLDGTTLEGWFIPADSDRLVIANHPLPCNRYGFPGHLPPWNALAFGGFEVNFLPELKHLRDAGYNILTYDLRNHGRSAAGSGGIVGIGLLEWRDVVGSLHYARARSDTAKMKLGLLSRCLGADSTFVAMARRPEEFAGVKAMVAVQPISIRPFVERAATAAGLSEAGGAAQFDAEYRRLTGFGLDELTPVPYARHVHVPTYVIQVRDDVLTKPEDVQTIFDHIAANEKKLYWIEGTTRRFDGYNWFGQHPESLIEWFNTYMRPH
jgi:pimeloyl-ACP methyl ester carboxylesterase